MIDSTTAGKKLCARHTPGEISLRDESRNARFQYKMDYPSPLEQKRRGTSVNDLKERIKI